jgi:hypothetical protein
MMQDNILYTDGHDVTVTDTMFHVKNMSYRLIGITKHGLHILRPHRQPAILFMIVGVLILLCGILNLVPSNYLSSGVVLGIALSGKTILMIAGAFIILVSILIMGLLHERYAVRISTAEGEKDVVVSKQKEYVAQIINALNRAFNFSREKK